MERDASKTKKENDAAAQNLPARVKGLKDDSVSGIIGWFSISVSFTFVFVDHSNVSL